METEVIVPDAIILKSDTAERIIRLENCQNQNEIIDYLKICMSLCYVHLPDRMNKDFEKKYEIPETENMSRLCVTKI